MSSYNWPPQAGSGTVTSIALTAPASILSVAGSPITSSGTFALSLVTQTANTVWAGPTSGGAATPTFRVLVPADLPTGSSIYFNVKSYGAIGNGSTDDTTSIRAAITAASSGGTIYFPAGTYKVTASLSISVAGTSVLGDGQSSKLHFTNNTAGFNVTASGFNISNIWLYGFGGDFLGDDLKAAVYASGTDVNNYISNIHVSNCRLSNFNGEGVLFSFVENSSVLNCVIEDMGYAGILGASVNYSTFSNNTISGINTDSSYINAYGIGFGRTAGDPATYPANTFLVIDANVVSNIPNWHGIDFHFATDSIISNNQISQCPVGISVTAGNSVPDAAFFVAPKRITISNNNLNLTQTGNGGNGGITISGQFVGGSWTDYATDISITGNYILGGGSDSNDCGAIFLEGTQNTSLTSNQMDQPTRSAIVVYDANFGFNIVGNTAIDAYSAAGAGAFLRIPTDNQTGGYVSDNSLIRGTFSASNVNNYFVNQSSFTPSTLDIKYGYNYAKTATAFNSNPETSLGFNANQYEQQRYFSAAPASGAWLKNQIVYQSSSASGSPVGWVCTVAGTPGTWVALPTLGSTSDVTLAAVGSSPNGNGASLSGQVLSLQPCDGSNPGVLTSSTQNIGGAKTLLNSLTITDSSTSGTLILNPTTSSAGIIVFKNVAASGHFNWQLAGQQQGNNQFTLTPSTATDGTTFSNPMVTFDANAKTIALATNGTTALSISSGQVTTFPNAGVIVSGGTLQVTIGTDAMLRIDRGTTSAAGARFTNTAANGNYWIGTLSSEWRTYLGSDTSGTILQRMDSAGTLTQLGDLRTKSTNVQIGNSQGATFDGLVSLGRSDSDLRLVGDTGSGSGGEIRLYGSSAGAANRLDFFSNGTAILRYDPTATNKWNFVSGAVTISDSTASTTSSTGALVVTGGLGVGGAVNIGNTLTVSSTTLLSSTFQTLGTIAHENHGIYSGNNSSSIDVRAFSRQGYGFSGDLGSGTTTYGMWFDPAPKTNSTTSWSQIYTYINGTGTSTGMNTMNAIWIDDQNLGTTTASRVNQLYLVPQSAGTNRAAITDNITYTGTWFINQSGSARSFLGGSLIIGNGLTTNAVDGFLYIPTCAGTPIGTPTTQSGTVAMIYDTTNNKFYIYNGAWKGGTNPGIFV